MPQEKSSLYSIRKACSIIFLSSLIVIVSALLISWYYGSIRNKRMSDEAYQIKALVQTGPDKEPLKTVYLAEWLNLSVDRPTSIYRFNPRAAEQKLLSHPLIKSALVKKVMPDTVYVDYEVRKPIAFLGDFTNTALDKSGVMFPFQPFFTPKNFPEIYLGLSALNLDGKAIWGSAVKGQKVDLAMNLLNALQKETAAVKKIDVSRVDAASEGQRQIIVVLEERMEREKEGHSILYVYPRLLRLHAEHYIEGLQEYAVLRDYLQKKEREKEIDTSQSIVKGPLVIIDLRIPQLAFMSQ